MALMPFRRSNSSIPSSSSSSSSSSSHRPQFRYDVFLSFSGTDTRYNFISHLDKELIGEGIKTFKDDRELDRGKEISEILKTIEESRYSIVVISKNYGSSKWCLDELVKILECQNPREQMVPVFFHVKPSEVGNQTATFGGGFAELVSKHQMEIERVQSWKAAFKKVAKVSGFVYPDPQFESEAKLIEEIVVKIIPRENTSVDEGLVGMNSRIEEAIECLDLGRMMVVLLGYREWVELARQLLLELSMIVSVGYIFCISQLQFDTWQNEGNTGRQFKSSIMITHVTVSIGFCRSA